jgi:mannose-6-phosphate isomerase
MPDERIYPLTFVPVFRDYIWGGRHLETLYGRQLPPGIVAESWDVSGHSSSPTAVAAGYWAGRTLPEVTAVLGEALLGRNGAATAVGGAFPLLVKLLDANGDLSVQVHPDDDYAHAHENGDPGKTEMWYVLHAEPGTELIYGLAPGANAADFRRAAQTGRLNEQLHRLPIQAGDCVFVPAGTVHALLAGAVVAEVQQNSDTTYRVYDWGRLGADGQPRPLHLEKALAVIDWTRVAPGKVAPQILAAGNGLCQERLVVCPQFTAERVQLEAGAEFGGRCDGASFELWGCMAGGGEITWRGEPLAQAVVSFALLPATLGDYTVRTRTGGTWLRVFVEAS